MIVVRPDNEPFVDLVQVRAVGAFGTGLLVGRGHVLTALHCVCNPDNGWQVRSNLGVYLLRELQQGEERPHNARIVWPRTDALGTDPADVAILQINETDPPEALVEHPFGELPRSPTTGSARGFPKSAKGRQLPGGRIEHDQPGRVTYTSETRRALTIDATGRHELEDRERWAGLSGGPLLANGLIVGVMREVPEGWKGEAVEAEPLAPLLRNPDDASLRSLLGIDLPLLEPDLGRPIPRVVAPIYLDRLAVSPETRFLYAAQAVPFLGRQCEIDQLRKFLDSDVSFQWWLLTGSAGQGKSRLAFELCIRVQPSWHAGFLDKSVQFNWAIWDPQRPTLIVVDYAAERAEELHSVALALFRRRNEMRFPVRLLVIERNWKDVFDKELPWFSTYLGYGADRGALTSARYHKTDVLELGTSDDDVLWQQMVAVFQGANYPPPDRVYTLNCLRTIDPDRRPLFAALLADAVAHRRRDRALDRDALVRDVLDHDNAKYWQPEGIAPEDKHLLALITMTGELRVERMQALADATELIPHPRKFSPARYSTMSGKPANKLLTPLRPDIVGELFVLDLLQPQHDADLWRLQTIWRAAWNEAPGGVSQFVTRASADFSAHITMRHMFQLVIHTDSPRREPIDRSRHRAIAAVNLLLYLRNVLSIEEIRDGYNFLKVLGKTHRNDEYLVLLETEAIFVLVSQLNDREEFGEVRTFYNRLASVAKTYSANAGIRENLIRTLLNISSRLIKDKQLKEVHALYRTASTIAAAHPDEPMLSALSISVLSSLIKAFARNRKFTEAKRLYQTLSRIAKGSADGLRSLVWRREADCAANLVSDYCAAGRLVEAQRLYDQQLESSAPNRPPDGEDDVNVAVANSQVKGAVSLMSFFTERGNLEEADKYFGEIVRATETANLKTSHPDYPLQKLGEALVDLANVFGNEVRTADAQRVYDHLAAITEEGSPLVGLKVGGLFNLSLAYAKAGDVDTADALRGQLERILEPNSVPMARGLRARASMILIEPFCDKGRLSEARAFYDNIAALASKFPDESLLRQWQSRGAIGLIKAYYDARDISQAKVIHAQLATLRREYPGEQNVLFGFGFAVLFLSSLYEQSHDRLGAEDLLEEEKVRNSIVEDQELADILAVIERPDPPPDG